MGKTNKPQVEIRFRRSRNITIIALVGTLVLCIPTMLVLRSHTQNTKAREEAARQEAARQEQAKKDLQDKINNLGTQEGVEDIARDELGLVDPNTQVVKPNP